MDKKDEEDDTTHESSSHKEGDMSEDDDSDNDSVDSAQLLADITDVLNSSDLDFPGLAKSEKGITVSYLNKGRSTPKPSDQVSVKREIIQDVEKMQNSEKVVPTRDSRASSFKSVPSHKRSVDLSCTSENCQDAVTLIKQEIDPQILKDPVICLTRLDPNQITYKVQPYNNPPGSAQCLPPKTELSSRDRKARRKTEIKKSAWHDEDSSMSDISVSDVSDPEDESKVPTSVSAKSDPNLKQKGVKDKPSKTHEKNPKSNPLSHHKVRDKDTVSEEKKGIVASLSSLKSKSDSSNQTSASSLSQSKRSFPSGVKISNPIDKSKVNEMSSKSTEKDRKVTEKSKTTTDSRKRRLSKDDRGIDPSSQASLKYQKVPSAGEKKSGDLKHQDASSVKDKNQKISSVETKKTVDVTRLSNWRYELHLSPADIDDLSNESFRKFINLASDCAINFDSSLIGHPIKGHVHLYFGTAAQIQSGMQKLCQLSLNTPKILQGIIKCRHVKQVARDGSDMKWMYTDEVKLGFSMYSTWTEKVKQLVQVKDWKREDETKRKFAQIQRIPPIVSKEMISLLFPFSHNVHITKPYAGDQKKESSGHTSVEYENTALMETMLSCFRDFYAAKSGNGNPVWKLRIMNFTPRPEKMPVCSVTAIQRDTVMKNIPGPKTPANSTPKDKPKELAKPKHSDRYQSKASKESAWGRDDSRKRPYPAPDNMASGGGSEKKRRQSEGKPSASASDQPEEPSSQNPETDQSSLKMLAQLKGLDPNNVDVLRILEVQSQLTSLQALFSCSPMDDIASNLHVRETNDPEKSMNSSEDSLTTSSITEAEKQLRENIASKQKQLKELEAKLQGKRKTQKDNSPNQFDASLATVAASLNDEPLDFTKPAPKIEEAVKKDEERSKMFASNPSTLSFLSPPRKGKRNKQKESTFSEEDFALPLQFGKNVSKAAIKEIVHQNDKQTRGREDNRHSTNRSSQQENVNEQRPFSKGPAKGSASNATWDQRKQKANFDDRKLMEWTRRGQSKERPAFGSESRFLFEENEHSKSRGNLPQESFRLGQNRMHDNSDISHRERHPGEGERSQMAPEKMWQENFHAEMRQFPGRGIRFGSEERRALPGRKEAFGLNPEDEYWDQFEGADYNRGDPTYHGNRRDDAPFFRDDVRPERHSPFREGSEPIGARQRNQQSAPRETARAMFNQRNQETPPRENQRAMFDQRNQEASPRENLRAMFDQRNQQAAQGENLRAMFDQRNQQVSPRENLRAMFDQRNQQAAAMENPRAIFDQRNQQAAPRDSPSASYERQHQQEITEGRLFGSVPWMDGDRFEDSEVVRYPERPHGAFEYDQGNADKIPAHERDEDEAFGHRFLFPGEGTQRGRGSSLRARGFGARGRGSMDTRGGGHELATDATTAEERGTEFQRGGSVGRRGSEPQRGAGLRVRGHELLRGAGAGGRGSELQRGGAAGGRGTEPHKSFGMRGRGSEPQRGALVRGRGADVQRGGTAGGRGTEPPRGFGTRGKGHEPQRGAAAGGRGSELKRGGAVGGRGTEPPRCSGIGGRGHESQIGGPGDDRDWDMERPGGLTTRGRGPLPPRGRGTQPQTQRGMGFRRRDVDSQQGFEMRGLDGPQATQNERGSGPPLDIRMRGRGNETQRNTEFFQTDFEAQRGFGIGGRGRGIVGRDMEPEIGPEIEERGFECGRGAGIRGRGMQSQRARGMRGRDKEIHQGPDLRGSAPELSQRGCGTRGRGEPNQRGNRVRGNGRGLGSQSGSMALGRGRGFPDVRGEQSSFEDFGSFEESFHGQGSGGEGGRGFLNPDNFSDVREERGSFTEFGSFEESVRDEGESFAPIPVLNSSAMRGRRGQRPEKQRGRGRMSQRGRSQADMHSDDRFEEFANSVGNQESSPAPSFPRGGSNRGRGRHNNVQGGFEFGQMGVQEEDSSFNRAGPAAGAQQRGNGRGAGRGSALRGGGPPRGRGFGGPAAPGMGDNFGGGQFQPPQRGHELGGDFGGRGNFKAGLNDRPRGREGPPAVNFGRGGPARNMGNNNQNWPGMR